MDPNKIHVTDRLKYLPLTNVWGVYNKKAADNGALNLGQGNPSYRVPDFIKKCKHEAIDEDHNQACDSHGHPKLRAMLSNYYSTKLEREITPSNVIVGVGATNILANAFLGIMVPGDEVICFDPTFDIYQPQVEMVHGKSVFVALDAPSEANEWKWTINYEKLEAAFTDKTRVIVVNTPHNPTGKVFTKEELAKIADIVKKFPRVFVFTDEVYSNIVYDGGHLSMMAQVDGMFERTLTVNSASKIFSVTGWKVGWGIGTPELCNAVHAALQYNIFSLNVPAQVALEKIFEEAENPYEGEVNYYHAQRKYFQTNRDRIVDILKNCGINWKIINSEGSFFQTLYVKDVVVPDKYKHDELGNERAHDSAVSEYITVEKKVTMLPYTPFLKTSEASYFLRVALCKKPEEIDVLAERLPPQ